MAIDLDESDLAIDGNTFVFQRVRPPHDNLTHVNDCVVSLLRRLKSLPGEAEQSLILSIKSSVTELPDPDYAKLAIVECETLQTLIVSRNAWEVQMDFRWPANGSHPSGVNSSTGGASGGSEGFSYNNVPVAFDRHADPLTFRFDATQIADGLIRYASSSVSQSVRTFGNRETARHIGRRIVSALTLPVPLPLTDRLTSEGTSESRTEE
ncbi:hypothetical protein BCR39DRAFT_561165 [Naematelia encephala]|uniref:Uncharacterized protein n=1 Tax=Naematelia encephala TaxID=71784 RepID=A0A1Y2ARV5_9TREE|nr:hypothetical protein BCR39DRAFT_561165 [Naematelia encephala]